MSDDKSPAHARNQTLSAGTERKDTSSWKTKLEAATGVKADQLKRSRSLDSVYILLDASGSMGGEKLKSAQSGALAFSAQADRQGYSVGLIVFATTAGCFREADRGLDGLDSALSRIEAAGSTDLAGALQLGVSKIGHRAGKRVLYVVTDGQPDDRAKAVAAARDAANRGIEIMALGTDDADRQFLDQIVTSKELAVTVSRQQLSAGVSQMARLLPGG